MKDSYGREITYLRVSVTDCCNFRCQYCMPVETISKKSHEDILQAEDFVKIVGAAADLGISKVRITGGEPLIRRGIVSLCENIANVRGITDVGITTNGSLLAEYAGDLLKAGVSRVNISLDSLEADKYERITRGGSLGAVLAGIDAALEQNFDSVKINTVLMAGVNDYEIGDFVDFAKKKNVAVRFIELMPIGEGSRFYDDCYVSTDLVISRYPELIQIGTIGVASMYEIPGGSGKIGLISPISHGFCENCGRLRLTADGKLRPCLHSGEEISVKGLKDHELKEAIRRAVLQKPKNMQPSGDRNMNEIGG